jgi:hypothetical protein
MMKAAWDSFVQGIVQMWDTIKMIFGAIGDFFMNGFSAEAQMKVVSGEMPMMADGGTVKARPGGTAVILGEAGKDEVVMDSGKWNQHLEQMLAGGVASGGGDVINFNIYPRENESIEELAQQLSDHIDFVRTR